MKSPPTIYILSAERIRTLEILQVQYHDAVGIPSWIFRYYIDPIIYDTSYNPVDTVTWALMLGIMVLALARASKKFDIKFDEGLVAATMPYILAGSSLRVMEDTRIVIPPLSYLLITPLIYFLVFFVTSSSPGPDQVDLERKLP